ncbi:MAG: YigZ family protein, partial [Mycoplasmoidaceae bacterium]|nr:YigZ family protein [Mycoplasmoidaceae bacterium]
MFCFKTTNLYKETINKSKFVCLAFNISNSEEGKEIIKRLHTEYPDASHICYAYVLGNNQEDFFYSDDGEPNKTAGLPIYNNMKKYKLSFCMIAIIRYFGGIKFGVSALKDCFSNLANKLIELNKLVSVKKVNLFK